jgi:hypothetical protein
MRWRAHRWMCIGVGSARDVVVIAVVTRDMRAEERVIAREDRTITG